VWWCHSIIKAAVPADPAFHKIAIESTAVAAASFSYHSLIPGGTKNVAVRLFFAGGAFFVANTVPSAIMAAISEGRRIGQTWKQHHFWSFPHYFVGASAAGFLSTRNAFLHWEACMLLTPVLYVLYRAHRLQEAADEEQRILSRLHAEDLQAAASQLNAVLESTTDCVLAIDRDGRIRYTNQRARARLFGESEAVGTLLWARFPKLTEGALKEQLAKSLQNKTLWRARNSCRS